jgi:mannose PTS system EIIA component
MSIGLLLITHDTIGSSLLESATKMLGLCPLLTETLAVTTDSNPDQLREQAQAMTEDLDQGDGVLVLTDMYGSTPSNIATSLLKRGRVAVVSGINLPMLVRVLNYSPLSLDNLSAKAVSGGCDGIVECHGEAA